LFRTHIGLWLILFGFITLATCYSLIVPLTQGEDELAHYRYISFIAQTGRLPINSAERKQAWYRADWPPLYHLLVGAAVSSLDTTRPHLKDVGESPRRRLVGEIFYPRLIIYTADANFPWQDGILAWHIGRFMSIFFATIALVFTYLTALDVAQTSQVLKTCEVSIKTFATLTTALLAFTPRFLFSSAMLSDDSLFILLSAIIIWLLWRILHGNNRWWYYALIGLLFGLSIVTKYSTGLLPLIIIPATWWLNLTSKIQNPKSKIALTWLFTLIGASWWFGWIGYYFNTIKQDGLFFGLLHPLLASGPDVSMRRIFAFFTGNPFTGQERPAAIAPGTFSDWLIYLFQTFWGVPVLEHDPLFPWAYLLIFVVCFMALVGLWQLWKTAEAETRFKLFILTMFVVLLLPFPVLRFFLTHNILETGQGRHILYPAAQAIPILLMLGLWNFGVRSNSLFLTPYFLLLPWSLFQLGYMTMTYPAPLSVQTTTFKPLVITHPLKHDFGDAIRLLGYDFKPAADRAYLTLYWQARQQVEENYRVQVQFLDPQNQAQLTWLSQPLNGRYPTRAWDKDDVVQDTLPVPLVNLPANDYRLTLNLWREAKDKPLLKQALLLTEFKQPPPPSNPSTDCHLWTERLPARQRNTLALTCRDRNLAQIALVGSDNIPRRPDALSPAMAIFMVGLDWPSGEYRLQDPHEILGLQLTVANEARLFQLPKIDGFTTVEANFADHIKLLGYTLPTRRVEVGGGLPLTLYWQSLAPVVGDYVVFDKVLGEDLKVYGGYDRLPREYYSTILWGNGEIVEDGFGVPISPNAPPGVYNLHIGLYTRATGEPISLPLLENGKPSNSSSVVIGPVKIGGPPDGATTKKAAPQITLNQPFGNQITLLGYDIIQNQKSNNLKLTLYWQVNAPLAQSYTTFLHLRDMANQNVAQLDRPPVNGRYPTNLWDAGEIVVDEISLPLTTVATGTYTPVVGLYDPSNGTRLSVTGVFENEVRLEKINHVGFTH